MLTFHNFYNLYIKFLSTKMIKTNEITACFCYPLFFLLSVKLPTPTFHSILSSSVILFLSLLRWDMWLESKGKKVADIPFPLSFLFPFPFSFPPLNQFILSSVFFLCLIRNTGSLHHVLIVFLLHRKNLLSQGIPIFLFLSSYIWSFDSAFLIFEFLHCFFSDYPFLKCHPVP